MVAPSQWDSDVRSLRCASAIQIVRPRESTAETQPKLQPGFLEIVNCLHWVRVQVQVR